VDNARDGYFEVIKKFNKKFDLHAVIGTPGAGKHTFVALLHGQWTLAALLDDPNAKTKLPEDLHPLAEIEFPSKALTGHPSGLKPCCCCIAGEGQGPQYVRAWPYDGRPSSLPQRRLK
jgi:hypothetical protein